MRLFASSFCLLIVATLSAYAAPFEVTGAAADGSKDDGPAIQNALQAASETGGGEVFLPAGKYRIDDHIEIPAGVTLSGSWEAPHHSDQNWGTALFAVGHEGEEDGPALIQLAPGATVKGLTIYYPNQRLDDIKAYPWAIQGRGMHGAVLNVTLVNAWQGIDFGTHHNELHVIRNVFGCCLRRGVYINNCTDVGRLENVHFNPHYWGRTIGDHPQNFGKLIEFMNNNNEAFIFGRTDWEYVLNTFAFGFDKGYKFIKTEQGACNGNFLGIGADGGHYALWIEATQAPGLLITNGEFVSFSHDDSVQVTTTEDCRGLVQLNNCAFWGPSDKIAWLRGPASVSFQQCNFVQWNLKGGNSHAIHADNGELTVSTSFFGEAKPQIYLGPKLKGAVITGNRFKKEQLITNESKGSVQVGLNMEIKN